MRERYSYIFTLGRSSSSDKDKERAPLWSCLTVFDVDHCLAHTANNCSHCSAVDHSASIDNVAKAIMMWLIRAKAIQHNPLFKNFEIFFQIFHFLRSFLNISCSPPRISSYPPRIPWCPPHAWPSPQTLSFLWGIWSSSNDHVNFLLNDLSNWLDRVWISIPPKHYPFYLNQLVAVFFYLANHSKFL